MFATRPSLQCQVRARGGNDALRARYRLGLYSILSCIALFLCNTPGLCAPRAGPALRLGPALGPPSPTSSLIYTGQPVTIWGTRASMHSIIVLFFRFLKRIEWWVGGQRLDWNMYFEPNPLQKAKDAASKNRTVFTQVSFSSCNPIQN